MNARLSINCTELDEDDLQALCRDLSVTLNRETDVQAVLLDSPHVSGSRGDPVTVGAIALAFLSSGAAVGLFNVLRVYLQRNSSLQIELQREDGRNLKIQTQNLSSDQLHQTIELACDFLEGSG